VLRANPQAPPLSASNPARISSRIECSAGFNAPLLRRRADQHRHARAAEIIASDVSLLVTVNQAIDGVIQNNQKARQNPKALAQLDGYKRPLVGSLSANLQRFGMEKVGKLESLQEIIAEMTENDGTGEKTSPDCPLQRANCENDG
jgi:hypothetical protein